LTFLNVGSGQARFEGLGWTNVDCLSREGQRPDVVDDARTLQTFADGSADLIVLQHVLEHFVLPDATKVISACHRVLRPGGRLVVTLPNMRALAQAWLMGKIADFIFFVNTMGAYQGEDGDCHRWHYTDASFRSLLGAGWQVQPFDWRPLGGNARLACDWWIQGWEAVR
jgi:predicted SAM-dependent methyltransferase